MSSKHTHSLRSFAALLLCAAMAAAQAQSPAAASPAPQNPSPETAPQQPAAQPPAASPATQAQSAKPSKLPTTSERRRAAKLYMQAAALYQAQQFEKAIGLDLKAAALDPTNPDYGVAAELARSHAVTALIQQSAKDQNTGNREAARAALVHAQELDPQNPTIADHIRGLSESYLDNAAPFASPAMPALGSPIELQPKPGSQSFHLNTGLRQVIQQVFSAYGISAAVDTSVRSQRVRFDIDDATFAEAARALDMLSDSFYVPLDPHRVVVARDNNINRMQYQRNAVASVSLSGLTSNEMTEIGNIARTVFGVRQTSVDASAGMLTLRGPIDTLNAFNATYKDLQQGRSEVLLDVRMIQLAHTNARNTGIQPPQTVTAFNVYAQEQAILNQNQDLVQQIIASGLAAPGDTLTILGILLASGQVSSSLFQNGLILFGGGITQSGLAPQGVTFNLSLNSSDSRALDNYRIRLQDGEEGTLKSGTRYPIMTSSFSSLGASNLNIPGIGLPGTSGSLSGLLANAGLESTNIPQFQYQDLGLVLKARPRVLRSGDVAMTIDMKITALAGQSVNNVPVLANRSYTGAVTVPVNQGVVLAAEIDKTQMRAISGWPGLSEIPGLNNVTDKNVSTNEATLLIIITPHVVRSSHAAGHTPMLMVDKTPGNR